MDRPELDPVLCDCIYACFPKRKKRSLDEWVGGLIAGASVNFRKSLNAIIERFLINFQDKNGVFTIVMTKMPYLRILAMVF